MSNVQVEPLYAATAVLRKSPIILDMWMIVLNWVQDSTGMAVQQCGIQGGRFKSRFTVDFTVDQKFAYFLPDPTSF